MFQPSPLFAALITAFASGAYAQVLEVNEDADSGWEALAAAAAPKLSAST